MGLEFFGEGAGNEGWELRAGGQPSPMLQFGFFRPHHLLKLLGLTGLLPLLLQLEVQWKCPSHPRGAVSGGGPGADEPGAGAAAALSCVWWSLPGAGANACEKQIYFRLRFIFFTLRGVRQRLSSSMES